MAFCFQNAPRTSPLRPHRPGRLELFRPNAVLSPARFPSILPQIAIFSAQFATLMASGTVIPASQVPAKFAPVVRDLAFVVMNVAPQAMIIFPS
jgi:hypothetical protein